MALQIITPEASFVRWGEGSGVLDECIFNNIRRCLPVMVYDDLAFQFILQGLPEEIDGLCGPYGTPIQFGIVSECSDPDFLLEFEELPDVFKISETQLLVNWSHGVPDFHTVIDVGECFRIRVRIQGVENFCSNCFERIDDSCFSSVVEYGNDENAFGFNYCSGGTTDDENGGQGSEVCKSTVIPFNNKETLSIPYTQELEDLYGTAPTVQVWVYVGAELQNVMIQQTWDSYPPTSLDFNFGGLSSGVIVIK